MSKIDNASDRLLKRMADEFDRQIAASIYGTSTINPAPSKPITVDDIRKAMLKMPPRETWLSSRLFPSDSALVVEGAGERFTCAGSGFWFRLEDAVRKQTTPSYDRNPLGFNLRPIEIDACEDDNEATAIWRADHWTRLREAFEVAMMPLPEWLGPAPKFGKHG